MTKRFRRRSSIRSSRLKGLSAFIDNFTLVSGMKSPWKSYRGLWSSNGSNAISATEASEYPLSAITMSRSSGTFSASVTGGTGLSFWVSDANNWYATISYNTSNTYDVPDQGFVENTNNPPAGNCVSSVNSSVVQSSVCDQGFVQNGNNPPAGNCCSGVSYTPPEPAYSYTYSYGATYQNAYSYSYSYGASYTAPYSYSYSYSATVTSGYSYSATATTTSQQYCCGTTQIAKSFFERTNYIPKCGECPGSCSEGYSFAQCCYTSGTIISGSSCYYPGGTTYSCPSGGSLSGTTCTVAGSTTCPSGGSLSGSTCYVNVNVAGGYSCPSGGSLSGTTCNVNVNVPAQYTCPNGGSLSGSTCYATVNVGAVAARYGCYTSTSSVNTTYYSCYTATRSVTDYYYYLKVIRSSGGAVSSVGSDLALASAAAAIKIEVSGNDVVSTAYSNAGMTTSLGSRTDSFISPAQTKLFGIIKSPSPYNQGLTVSDFNATI